MNRKSYLIAFLIVVGLVATTSITYALGRFFTDTTLPAAPGLPPLSKLDLLPQTQNGYTATVESYYADAARLVFKVNTTSEKGDVFLSNFSLKDESGQEINSGMSFDSQGPSPFHSTVEFDPAIPLKTERMKGQLTFAVVASADNPEAIAQFAFDLNLPIHPALTFNPKQTIFANGMEILLDRLVVTSAYTYAYLCYLKPTDADWAPSQESNLRIGSQQSGVANYSLLFDSAFADGSKGGEPGWTPPVQTGRCIKIGFPIGDTDPTSITLTIPALEQSMPEVIPADELIGAQERLKEQGIDMEWHIVDHGAYPEYKKLPVGMSEQAAFRKFIEALGYVYKGPWAFKLQLKSTENSQLEFSTSEYGAPTPIPLSSEEPNIAAVLPGRIRSFDVSPDLKTIAFATSQGVVLYDLESYKQLRTLHEAESTYVVAWSPDEKKLAAGGIVMGSSEFGKSHLIAWDTSAWQIIFEQTGQDETLDSIYGDIAWSPDNRSLAESINGTGVLVHDIQTGKTISHQEMLSSYEISWSPDGSRLVATGDLAYGIRRWKVSTDESVRLFDQRASSSMKIAWSPDGKRIASGHAQGAVCFWTAATNKCDGFIQAHRNAVFSLVWSPDGNRLATGGGVIRIWDSQTGKLLTSFGPNNGSIYTQLIWPAPDQPLVSLEAGYASEGLTIVRFWDVDTGKTLLEFDGASGSFGE